LGPQVAGDPDDDVPLADVEREAPVQPVPPGKDHRIIGIGLPADGGVVHPMHAGGDEHPVQPPLPGHGQAQVAVVKQGGAVEPHFIDQVSQRRHADQAHLEEAEDRGVEHLAPVKAERRGHIHVRVGVVDVVEAPQEGPGVIEAVPVVEGEVHEEDAGGHLDPERQMNQVEEPEGVLLRPECAPQGRGPDREHPGDEAQAGEGAIHHVARPPPPF